MTAAKSRRLLNPLRDPPRALATQRVPRLIAAKNQGTTPGAVLQTYDGGDRSEKVWATAIGILIAAGPSSAELITANGKT